MSAEQYLVVETVRTGSPRKIFQAGLTLEDFEVFEEEMEWIIGEYEKRHGISVEDFKRKFPDFEMISSDQSFSVLVESFRRERAFVSVSSALDEIGAKLDFDNALEKAEELKDILGEVIKVHGTVPHTELRDYKKHLLYMRQLMLMREAGESPGIPTGLPTLDFHLGGLQGENLYLILGRPGDGKSYFLSKLAVEAMLDGRRVGFFSPEMNEHQHRARINTLLSANAKIQEAVGLVRPFKNRALMDGTGYNIKSYQRFLEYVHEEIEGEIQLYSSRFRRKPTIGNLEGWVERSRIDLLIIDPIYKIRAPRRRESKYAELGDIVDAIEDIAQFYDIPVIVTNQANRALVGGKGEVPSKDTSYGSDVPVQEADYVIGVKYDPDDEMLYLKCSKSRFGKAFKLEVRLNPNTGFMQEDIPHFNEGITPEEAHALLSRMEEEA